MSRGKGVQVKGSGEPARSDHDFSVSPGGEVFAMPTPHDHERERVRLHQLVKEQRLRGREIVVVMGLGFVGAMMAAVIADSSAGGTAAPSMFVIALQRPSARSYWKIPYLNKGIFPIEADDPDVLTITRRCVCEKKTLIATFSFEALKFADVVVVDIQCDFLKQALGDVKSGSADITALEDSFRIIGGHIPPRCLVLIETTVPPGTTEYIAHPILRKAFETRGIRSDPLIAHSFERVMPGRDYLSSIGNMWRVCSGINEESKTRAREFLSRVINVEQYPLTLLDRPIESETCKIIENSYRATLLAFMHEWSIFCERNGVDLVKVIEAIKMRPTHNNMLFPGPGIGGYCLPKDGGLGMWSYKHLMGFQDDIFKITPMAIDINDTRALHAVQLVRDGLRNMGKIVAACSISVLGASYKEGVGDTRYSGSEVLVRKLVEMGGEVRVHDPFVKNWWELKNQDTYPATGLSLSRFFRNQEHLRSMEIEKDMESCLKGTDAVVLAVPHEPYLRLSPDDVCQMAGGPVAVVDCFGMLRDEQINRYFQLGCEVKGLGRGHIKRIKEKVRQSRAEGPASAT